MHTALVWCEHCTKLSTGVVWFSEHFDASISLALPPLPPGIVPTPAPEDSELRWSAEKLAERVAKAGAFLLRVG